MAVTLNSIGDIGATYVDGNGNVTFHFCLVPVGNYEGGALLLHNYTWTPEERGCRRCI